MRQEWRLLLSMSPTIIEGLVILICGIYQLKTGKESFWMYGYAKKYNYEKNKEKFIKSIGIYFIAIALFLMVILPILAIYAYSTELWLILIPVPVLIIVVIGENIILKRCADNLEDRNN